MNDTTLLSDNPLRFRKNLFKMSISEKIRTINNKIEQNKAQYNLDRQTAKISTLSLPEKDLLEKAAALRRFAYSPLGKENKIQTGVAENQHQK